MKESFTINKHEMPTFIAALVWWYGRNPDKPVPKFMTAARLFQENVRMPLHPAHVAGMIREMCGCLEMTKEEMDHLFNYETSQERREKRAEQERLKEESVLHAERDTHEI